MEEIIPIEKIVKVLKGIIDRNGTKYIASKPFQVYEKLLESKDVDKRTAIALLNVFVSEIIPCDDEKLLSNLIQTECCFNKNMADRLASILSMLYSDKNKKEWSTKINEGLNQFLKEEFSFDW